MQHCSSEMIAKLAVISDVFFGENYFENHIYPLFLLHKSSILYVAFDSSHTVAGFSFGFSIPRSDLVNIIRVPLPDSLKLSENIGILNTVAIRQDYQHQHLGKQLITAVLNDFRISDIHTCFAIGWKYNNIVAADHLNKAFHFQIIGEQTDFWLQDTLHKKYRCSRCGNVCHCSAVIYYLEV